MRRWLGLLFLSLVLAGCALGSQGADTEAIRGVVQEYFDLRGSSLIRKDTTPLYERFPDLAKGADPDSGVNAEAHWIDLHRGILFTGAARIEIEHYQPLRIKVEGNRATVNARGLALYAYDNKNGSAGESGGGFNMTLLLERQSGAWTVIKTDEVNLAEAKTRK